MNEKRLNTHDTYIKLCFHTEIETIKKELDDISSRSHTVLVYVVMVSVYIVVLNVWRGISVGWEI
jgi:hypothetical protein